MRIIANDFKENEVFKMVREWTELTQEELAKELGYKNYHTIKQIERGVNSYTFEKLMEIARKHGYQIIIQKEERKEK